MTSVQSGSVLPLSAAVTSPLSWFVDWTRAMVATEIAFASDLLGVGTEWVVIDGRPDEYWVRILRTLQNKVPQARRYLDH